MSTTRKARMTKRQRLLLKELEKEGKGKTPYEITLARFHRQIHTSGSPVIFVVTGIQGSGKTTISQRLGELLGLHVLCQDDLYRDHLNYLRKTHQLVRQAMPHLQVDETIFRQFSDDEQREFARTFDRKFREYVRTGQSFVLDRTVLNDKFHDLIRSVPNYRVIFVQTTPVQVQDQEPQPVQELVDISLPAALEPLKEQLLEQLVQQLAISFPTDQAVGKHVLKCFERCLTRLSQTDHPTFSVATFSQGEPVQIDMLIKMFKALVDTYGRYSTYFRGKGSHGFNNVHGLEKITFFFEEWTGLNEVEFQNMIKRLSNCYNRV